VTALVNLVTKRVAPEWGVAFTLAFFGVFTASEWLSRRRTSGGQHVEKFNVRTTPDLDPARIGLRGRVRKLVAVRDPKNLSHLDRALAEAHREDVDVVVLTVKVERGPGANGTEPHLSGDELALFTAVVNRAEEHGKTVTPLAVTSNDLLFAIARVAKELGAREVIFGRSAKFAPDFQAESFALRWGQVEDDPNREMLVRVLTDHEDLRFSL
jgi:hypothetical protein